jgi:CheB methylesterase
VHDHRIVLSEGPTENGHRPAINALFRSVALNYGQRAVGVLLSGVLDDGTLGLAAIRSRGGTTIAQTPQEALFTAMPLNAIEAGVVDHVVSAVEVGSLLKQLAGRVFEEREMEPDARMELENRIAMARRFSTEIDAEPLGAPSGYTCPDCNGGLISVSEGNYRCQVFPGRRQTGPLLVSLLNFVEQHRVAAGRRRRSHLPPAGRDGDAGICRAGHGADGTLGQFPQDRFDVSVLPLLQGVHQLSDFADDSTPANARRHIGPPSARFDRDVHMLPPSGTPGNSPSHGQRR